MQRILYFICFMMTISQVALCQPRITNVRFEVREKSKVIEIRYDAQGLVQSDSVYIIAKTRKGHEIRPRTLQGNVGTGLKAGKNKKVIWDVVADDLRVNEEVGIVINVWSLPVPVVAVRDSIPPRRPIVAKAPKGKLNGMALLTLGAGLAAGGALAYQGYLQKGRSQDNYDLYKSRNWNHKNDLNLAGNDTYLQTLYKSSAEQAETDLKLAKRQQMMSRVFTYGGIAVAVVDAVLMLPRLRSRANKKAALRFDWGPEMVSVGVKITF